MINNFSILVIGGGSIGRRHISNFKKIGLNKNIYVLKRKNDNDFAKEYGVKVVTNINQLIDISIDITFICSPTSLHYDGLEIANKLNSHIFIEKPLTHDKLTLEKIKKIIRILN